MAYARYPDPLLLHVLYKPIWFQACVCNSNDPGTRFLLRYMHQVPACYGGLICTHSKCLTHNGEVTWIISLMPDEGHKAKMSTLDQCINPRGSVKATVQSLFGCSANLSRHEAGSELHVATGHKCFGRARTMHQECTSVTSILEVAC